MIFVLFENWAKLDRILCRCRFRRSIFGDANVKKKNTQRMMNDENDSCDLKLLWKSFYADTLVLSVAVIVLLLSCIVSVYIRCVDADN